MSTEKQKHAEGSMRTLIETTHGVESVALVGEGVKELLEHDGLLDAVNEFLSNAALPTIGTLSVAVPGLHVVTPLIAFLLYRKAKRKQAASAEERRRFEEEERAEHGRIVSYLQALSDPALRADEARAREQIRYLVGSAAKKEDVWDVSQKLDRLLTLSREQVNAIEAAPVPADFSSFLHELPTLVDEIAGLREDVKAVAAKQDEQLRILRKLQPAPTADWRIPVPSAYFTGQDRYLEDLRKILDAGETGGITQPTGLRGFGGIGKTELALAYAQRNRDRYDIGYFIVAESLSALDFGLAKIADPKLSNEATQEQIGPLKAEALHKLGRTERALIVFDNVDEIVGTGEFQQVLAALPQAHVLLTCRHRGMGDHIRELEITKMDVSVGALYVLRLGLGNEKAGPWEWNEFSDSDREHARLIAEELDGLPLALHHAGSAIRSEGLTVAEFLADYRNNRVRILGNRGKPTATTHPDSAQVTVIRALERLRENDPAAAELVLCCAFLAPDAISEDLFTKKMVTMREPLASDLARFAAIRSAALASALIERVPTDGRLVIHRVTQAVLQDSDHVDAASRLGEITNNAVINLYRAGRYRDAIAHAEFASSERTRLLGDTTRTPSRA
ncbi:NB-ARC domain-containing protein [Fimbriimonas ginsengisoli]|uniref:Transcriptional regulator, XRE family n=1 Tax=Fimbriimonas ginsengisoli Gsoil 348 TaxID=661478 RepID=A0A068NJW0_FIMGI|nr:NB-ARC domain-containing protein [Fimbriimonas ginsengisoli]AIE83883.1 transcriptional regulator, XRE family [Fimbriimonas ginsengisoli Gsoil 348]